MIRVYLVEDQGMIREMLQIVLEMGGEMEVVGAAPNAEQALIELESLDTDVVLMDVQLPGINGVEAVRRLKETRCNLPVIMLSSFDDETVEQAIEAGALGYVLKTSAGSELKRAIDSALKSVASIDPALTARLFQRIRWPRQVDDASSLTDRQMEIIRMVSNGALHNDIAERLDLSETTVNREIRAIFDSLGTNDSAHAISECYKRGILIP